MHIGISYLYLSVALTFGCVSLITIINESCSRTVPFHSESLHVGASNAFPTYSSIFVTSILPLASTTLQHLWLRLHWKLPQE